MARGVLNDETNTKRIRKRILRNVAKLYATKRVGICPDNARNDILAGINTITRFAAASFETKIYTG